MPTSSCSTPPVKGTTFGTDDNQIMIINAQGAKKFDKKPKVEVAKDIINELENIL